MFCFRFEFSQQMVVKKQVKEHLVVVFRFLLTFLYALQLILQH